MTGAYFRVKRGDQIENIEIEHLTDAERAEKFAGKEPEFLLGAINLLCKTIAHIEPIFDQLERDGIIQKVSEPQTPENDDEEDANDSEAE